MKNAIILKTLIFLFVIAGITSCSNDNNALTVKVVELQEQVADLEKKNDQLNANLELVNQELEDAGATNASLTTANQSLSKANKELSLANQKLAINVENYKAKNAKLQYIVTNNYNVSKKAIDNDAEVFKNSQDQFTLRYMDCSRTKGEQDAECRNLKDNAERLTGRVDILKNIQSGEYMTEQK